MQPVQDLTVEDRVSRTQFQYTLEDPNADELNTYAPKMLARLKQLPELSDVATDQQVQGLRATLVFDRDTASRLGITPSTIDQTLYDAYGQREVSTIFTQLNQYHVVLEVKPVVPAESRRSARICSSARAPDPRAPRAWSRAGRPPRRCRRGPPIPATAASHCRQFVGGLRGSRHVHRQQPVGRRRHRVLQRCFPPAARCRSAPLRTWKPSPSPSPSTTRASSR